DQVAAVGTERHGGESHGGFSLCGREPKLFPFCPRVPDPKGIVGPRGDAMAFGVPRHTEDSSRPAADRLHVAPELGARLAGLRIPDPHEPVAAGRSNLQAVGAEPHAADFMVVLGEGQGFLAGLVLPEWGPIPDANGPVEAGRSETVAVRAECQTVA